MFNIKSLIIVLLFLHSIICLKSNDFCIIKQKECKGFYDLKNNYKTKCNLIKCHGQFKYESSPNICSNNKTALDLYNKWLILIKENAIDSNAAKKFKLFNKHINDCKNKSYRFNSNDFCIKTKNCSLTQLKRFECGKYCTINSISCNYYKSNEKNRNFGKIIQCQFDLNSFWRNIIMNVL